MAVSGSTPRGWPEIRAAVETHSGGLIIDRDGAPAAALPNEEFAAKDSELARLRCRMPYRWH